jgi:hypothetical protein
VNDLLLTKKKRHEKRRDEIKNKLNYRRMQENLSSSKQKLVETFQSKNMTIFLHIQSNKNN